MSRKSLLLQDFKQQIDRKEIWTVQEFSALTGYSEAFIREQIQMGEIKIFLPAGRSEVKITREGLNDWIDRRSYFKQVG